MRNGLTFVRRDSGQSLVETVIMLPLLLLLLLNALNFGYFFLVTTNLTAAPRNGVEYGIIGGDTPSAQSLPQSGPPTCTSATDTGCLSTSYLTYRDITGAIANATGATVQVCSQMNIDTTTKSGLNGTGLNQKANCVVCSNGTCGNPGTGTWTPASDPEANSDSTAPAFVLNRVDISKPFIPLIPGTPFNLLLLPITTCTSSNGSVSCVFHRQASMRAMN
jgi:hypothetical protein